MNAVVDPLLGLLCIALPLGLAYVILLLQSRNPDGVRRKAPAITPVELEQEVMELSCAEEKRAAQ